MKAVGAAGGAAGGARGEVTGSLFALLAKPAPNPSTETERRDLPNCRSL